MTPEAKLVAVIVAGVLIGPVLGCSVLFLSEWLSSRKPAVEAPTIEDMPESIQEFDEWHRDHTPFCAECMASKHSPDNPMCATAFQKLQEAMKAAIDSEKP